MIKKFIVVFLILIYISGVQVYAQETVDVSYNDAQCLMKIAQAEGGNQGIDGMVYIMNVVLNRVASPYFPDTIEEVITQEYQFESYTNGTYHKVVPSTDCHLALAQVEMNRRNNKQIIAFEVTENHNTLLRYFDYKFTHLQHDFYIMKESVYEKENVKNAGR